MSEVLPSILPPGFSLVNLDNDPDAETVLESMRCASDVPTFTGSQMENGSSKELFTSQATTSMSCANDANMQIYNASKTPDVKTNSSKDVFVTPVNQTPKGRVPLSSVSNLNSATRNLNQHLSDTTPTKAAGMLDPLTPTANLKLLISAASPEIRSRENKKKELFRQENESSTYGTDGVDVTENEYDGPHHVSRKDKSLGLLCLKFMSRFPEYPLKKEGVDVCLDEIAKDLNVERRRIYDIVNVLESVEMVSRLAKNKYIWHGKTNLVHTLARLKALGEAQGIWQQLEKVKEYEMVRELDMAASCKDESRVEELMFGTVRKERSLGIMSQKFLMLFLVSKPKTINLDLAAKILIGENEIDKTESAKYKTKIRRLYDIANILTSLQLIRKVHVTEVRGRKPAFQYVGPDVDNVNRDDLVVCSTDGVHRPSSKHSMLDCAQNPKLCTILNPTKAQTCKPASNTVDEVVKTRVALLKREDAPVKGKSSLTRHASFEQICQVAEEEREKLFLSQPGSPQSSQGSVGDTDGVQILNNVTNNKVGQLIFVSSGQQTTQGAKQVFIPLNKIKLTPVNHRSSAQTSSPSNNSTAPTKIAALLQLDRSKSQNISLLKVSTQPSVATKSSDGDTNNNGCSGLEVRRSKRMVQKSHLGEDFEYELPTKRIKTESACKDGSEESSPSQQDAEVACINQYQRRVVKANDRARPSPLRALHLDPEFNSSRPSTQLPVQKTPSPPGFSEGYYDLASPLPADPQSGDLECGVDINNKSASSASSQPCPTIRSAIGSQLIRPTIQMPSTAVHELSPIQFKQGSPPLILQPVNVGHLGLTPSGLRPLLINTAYLSPQTSPNLMTPNSSATDLENSGSSGLSMEYSFPQQHLAHINSSPELQQVFPPSISQIPLTVISPTNLVISQSSTQTPQPSMVRTNLSQSFSTPLQSTALEHPAGTPHNSIAITPNTFFRNTPGFIPMTSMSSHMTEAQTHQQIVDNTARRLTLTGSFPIQNY